jgi:hypothetical protein
MHFIFIVFSTLRFFAQNAYERYPVPVFEKATLKKALDFIREDYIKQGINQAKEKKDYGKTIVRFIYPFMN